MKTMAENQSEHADPQTASGPNPADSTSQSEATSPAESSLESQLQSVTAELDHARNQLLRTFAELENFRKRTNREREEERRYAALPLVRDLLPVIDNLQRAVEAGQSEGGTDALLQGVQMVLKQVEDLLARYDVRPIPALGLPFDPNVHEALQQVPTDQAPPGTVIRELQRGYQLHDRIVRPTQVIVSSEPKG